MNKSSLTADDLPPKVTLRDELLLRRLEEAIGKHFYQACDRITRALLSNCHWYFKTNTTSLTLLIFCYDRESYLNILNALSQIIKRIQRFSYNAKIHICPPPDNGIPWEMQVDEIADDGDCLSG